MTNFFQCVNTSSM